ncbi:hypothetical protein PIB30_024596 [Stylosanthes scabra]|uniref:Uncharacterized protein n=1 Tax=Stylosanthes scabra TaxID=79078 RepID=A0ABU6VC00_9FABA|nr:hypothetical protein [Stylosanthes scabra]
MRWFSSSAALCAAVAATAIFLLILSGRCLVAPDHHNPPRLPGVSIETPLLQVTTTYSCERVPVYGISRFNLLNYATSFVISVAPSAPTSERLQSQIHVCLHGDESLEWCGCQKDEWKSVQKGIWSAVMSPYETRYIDVRINGQISASITIALEEDLQGWSLISLVLGLALLFAPIITSRVPFCHGSSLVTMIFPVIVIPLFQDANFVILSTMLAGAALVYSVVSKFVFSEQDGTRNYWVSQFWILKWEMRIIGSTFIFQSTIDPPLAIGTLATIAVVYIIIKCLIVWPFISSRYKGSVTGRLPDTDESMRDSIQVGFISSYHTLENRMMFTKDQWVESIQRHTNEALSNLLASPDFVVWHAENRVRIQVAPHPHVPAENGSRLRALRNLIPWPWRSQEDLEIQI